MKTDVQSKCILLVDGDKDVVNALARHCQEVGLRSLGAGTPMEALKILQTNAGAVDLLLLDANLPGAEGLTLCNLVRAQPELANLPVILLSQQDDPAVRRQCAASHVDFVPKNADAWTAVEAVIRRVLKLEAGCTHPAPESGTQRAPRASEPPRCKKKVLLIDDDRILLKTLGRGLESAGYEVACADEGKKGYFMALEEQPDVVLLDYKMPEGWGNYILGKLKSNAQTRGIPIIMLSGMTDLGVQRDVLRLGAECWINKPIDVGEILNKVNEILG